MLYALQGALMDVHWNDLAPDLKARLVLEAELTLLAAESGQGKTWSLCQAALAEADRGALGVLVASPASFEQIEAAINERIWLAAYEEAGCSELLLSWATRTPEELLERLESFLRDVAQR